MLLSLSLFSFRSTKNSNILTTEGGLKKGRDATPKTKNKRLDAPSLTKLV
jgi:hypothetical protein